MIPVLEALKRWYTIIQYIKADNISFTNYTYLLFNLGGIRLNFFILTKTENLIAQHFWFLCYIKMIKLTIQ